MRLMRAALGRKVELGRHCRNPAPTQLHLLHVLARGQHLRLSMAQQRWRLAVPARHMQVRFLVHD
jgi:hypothetical protein